MEKFKQILALLKIKHYIKNIVVFIPLVFSLNFTNLALCGEALLAFVSFCFISSAIYILNDFHDIDSDKMHPIKKNRPLTSGKISYGFAFCILTILLLFSFLTAYKLGGAVLLIMFSYIILNISYTCYFKQIAIIDAVCIAIGFILRILAGCCAIGVLPSPLVILLTFFTSMFFTFSKRKLEFDILKEQDKKRKSIREYNSVLLNQFVSINAMLSIAFYFTYMLESKTITTPYLYITTIPFSVIIYRLLLLINTVQDCDDPAKLLYNDKIIHILCVMYLVILLLTIL